MPNRWTDAQRRRIYAALVKRDKEFCRQCGAKPDIGHRHDIDHIDDDKSNDALDNLQLLCRRCNVAKENKRRKAARAGTMSSDARHRNIEKRTPKPDSVPKTMSSDIEHRGHVIENDIEKSRRRQEQTDGSENPSALREREREREQGPRLFLAQAAEKRSLGYDEGSPELKINAAKEEAWNDWVWSKVEHQGYITDDDAKKAAAQALKFSPLTAARYLSKVASTEGWLVLNTHRFKFPVWEFTPAVQAELARKRTGAAGSKIVQMPLRDRDFEGKR